LLAQLFAESGDFTFVYNQGRCYQQNGISDKAINRFREYLRRAPNLSAQDRREVEEFIAELEKAQQQPPPLQPFPPAAAAPAPAVANSQTPVAPHSAQPHSDGSRLRKLGVGLAALGVVAVGAGVLLTVKMESLEGEVERDAATPATPGEDVKPKLDRGERLEAFQWLGYGLGVAALAAGTTCYLLGAREASERSIAFGGAPAPDGRGFSAWLGGRY
jgi:hypothetical protein